MKKYILKKGETAVVISGARKGDEGKVLQINKEKQRIILEGVNLRKKTIRKSQDNPNGGIIEIEAPIHISNVMHKDKHDLRKSNKNSEKESS
ncbi:MAG: 50S ribosomal protein L24 [Verrucomicrobiota bacterium]|nr:50S ribosomal protein L24 [Verrucomicrobiota bacterium]